MRGFSAQQILRQRVVTFAHCCSPALRRIVFVQRRLSAAFTAALQPSSQGYVSAQREYSSSAPFRRSPPSRESQRPLVAKRRGPTAPSPTIAALIASLKKKSSAEHPAADLHTVRRMLTKVNTAVVLCKQAGNALTIDLCVEWPQPGPPPTTILVVKSMAREMQDPAIKTLNRMRMLFAPAKQARGRTTGTRDNPLESCPEIVVFRRDTSSTPNALVPLNDTSVPNELFWKDAVSLVIGGCVTVEVKYNIPTITSLLPPSALYVGLPCVCTEVRTLFATESEIVFEWCEQPSQPDGASKPQPSRGRVVARGNGFTPSEDLIGKSLTIRVTPDEAQGLWTEMKLPQVQAAPPRVPRWDLLPKAPVAPAFRVVSYNVLHDELCTSKFAKTRIYPFATDEVLSLANRQVRIVQELLAYQGDIVAMQECGKQVFERFFSGTLGHLGFVSHFARKNGNAKEGCALFVRQDRFDCVALAHDVAAGETPDAAVVSSESRSAARGETLESAASGSQVTLPLNFDTLHCEFPQLAADIASNYPELHEALRNVPSVCQIVCLRERSPTEGSGAASANSANRYLVVGNTHLFYHANACHIRALQAYLLLHLLQKTKERLRRQLNRDGALATGDTPVCGVVLCGDFNFTPVTGGYALVTRGVVDEGNACWQKGSLFYWGCDRLLGVPEEGGELPAGDAAHATDAVDDSGDAESEAGAAVAAARQAPKQVLAVALQGALTLVDSYGQACHPPLRWTNYAISFREVLDYIFFSPDALDVLGVLPPPPEEAVSANVALPNRDYPSDHIAIVSDLTFK